jgi:hypothetical protein
MQWLRQAEDVFMSIAALILILLLPFAVGIAFNRLEAGRKSRRFG